MDRIETAERFGDVITADHKVLDEEQESSLPHKYAVIVQDMATQWIQRYPCKIKSAQETQRSRRKFLRPEEHPSSINTDNCLELVKVWEELNWNHERSTLADPKQMELLNELYYG